MPLGGEWSLMASDNVTTGIGVAIADSIMYQENKAYILQGPFGQLMPLIERGVPVNSVVLERSGDMSYMDSHKVIVLSYEDFKPENEEMNTDLAAWVQRGGVLVLLGNSNDALDNNNYFWWKQQGFASPMHHLVSLLGGTGTGEWGFGSGYVIRNEISPKSFSSPSIAENVYLPIINQALQHTASGETLSTPGYFMMKRGPFVIADARRQSISVEGKFVDIFDTSLPVVDGISLAIGESGLYRDVTEILEGNGLPLVLHATHRLMTQQSNTAGIEFSINGPEDTPAVVRLFLGERSIWNMTAINSDGLSIPITSIIEGVTALLEFPNDPEGVDVTVLTSIPGDFDLNGKVNGEDFLLWQRGGSPNPFSASDLANWEAYYGTGTTVNPVTNTAKVPEPSLGVLILFGLGYLLSSRRVRGLSPLSSVAT